SDLAQLAEQPAVNRQVVGSSPTGGAKPQVRGLEVFLCSDRVGRYLRKPSTNARLSRAPGRGRPQWRPPSYERLADSPVPSLRERPRRSRSTRVATRGRHGSGRPAQPCVLPWLPTSCDGPSRDECARSGERTVPAHGGPSRGGPAECPPRRETGAEADRTRSRRSARACRVRSPGRGARASRSQVVDGRASSSRPSPAMWPRTPDTLPALCSRAPGYHGRCEWASRPSSGRGLNGAECGAAGFGQHRRNPLTYRGGPGGSNQSGLRQDVRGVLITAGQAVDEQIGNPARGDLGASGAHGAKQSE